MFCACDQDWRLDAGSENCRALRSDEKPPTFLHAYVLNLAVLCIESRPYKENLVVKILSPQGLWGES